MEHKTVGLWEWLIPLMFIVSSGWAIWHIPAYILDFIPSSSASVVDQMSALHARKDVTPNMPGLFGGFADAIDWAALIVMPIIFFVGTRTVRVAHMEYQDWRPIDRIALFFGRLTMILVFLMTSVMLYEVFLRYIIRQPTLWANELTLWIAGFVFLCSGLYAMQQRCHIRIFLLYDLVPRWMQHTFDLMSTALIALFAFFLVYGSFYQVFVIKFYRWEMFGTAFDPPIPATLQPAILIIVTLIAIQAVINVISDWNLEPAIHTAADDIDQDEIDAIKRGVGAN